jgi:parallel beta-helix repeat protein
MRKLLSILLIFAFIMSIGAASAATLNVPGNYKTIQGAINAAHSGDTIKVASGTYKENLKITDKTVSLTGSYYPSIYGCSFAAGGRGKLYGFAVTKNGVSLSESGNDIIQNCAFTNCGISIITGSCSDNQLINNKITNGGICIFDSQNNIITGNYIYKGKIGLTLSDGASCKLVTKNTFKNCDVGVKMESKAGDWMINNIYSGNKKNFSIVSV